jgi:hypothetical protein
MYGFSISPSLSFSFRKSHILKLLARFRKTHSFKIFIGSIALLLAF